MQTNIDHLKQLQSALAAATAAATDDDDETNTKISELKETLKSKFHIDLDDIQEDGRTVGGRDQELRSLLDAEATRRYESSPGSDSSSSTDCLSQAFLPSQPRQRPENPDYSNDNIVEYLQQLRIRQQQERELPRSSNNTALFQQIRDLSGKLQQYKASKVKSDRNIDWLQKQILGKQNELEQAESESGKNIEHLQEEVQELQHELRQCKVVEMQYQQQVNNMRSELQQSEKVELEYKNKIERLQEQVQTLQGRVQSVEGKYDQCLEENSNLKEDLKQTKQQGEDALKHTKQQGEDALKNTKQQGDDALMHMKQQMEESAIRSFKRIYKLKRQFARFGQDVAATKIQVFWRTYIKNLKRNWASIKPTPFVKHYSYGEKPVQSK